MRIALHTGKGGVGKTTVAAATAIAAAVAGHRTLLLSADPAHSIADVLDVVVGSDPTSVPGVQNLWAAQVDVRGRVEQGWAQVRDYLVEVLSAGGMAQVQAEELLVLPGAAEVVTLLDVHRYTSGGLFDVLVVDCAPTGDTLRLLAAPETLRFFVSNLMGAPAKLMRSLAGLLAGRGGGLPGLPGADVRTALAELSDQLAGVRTLLADASMSAVRIVLTAEAVVVAEARRLFTSLSLHGFTVEGVVVNRLWPGEVGGEFFRQSRLSQAAALESIVESFGDLPIHRVTLAPTEPVGVKQLGRLSVELFDGVDPFLDRPAPVGLVATGGDGAFQLRLPLPLARKSEIDLSRSGDDLIVTVAQDRRRIALPSLLQRCMITGASFEGDALVVEFVPDPKRWPSALLEANQPPTDLATAG